jgi:hypothetical protein
VIGTEHIPFLSAHSLRLLSKQSVTMRAMWSLCKRCVAVRIKIVYFQHTLCNYCVSSFKLVTFWTAAKMHLKTCSACVESSQYWRPLLWPLHVRMILFVSSHKLISSGTWHSARDLSDQRRLLATCTRPLSVSPIVATVQLCSLDATQVAVLLTSLACSESL